MQGWQGRILKIDLDTSTATPEPLSAEIAARYLGGRGLAASYIANSLDPCVDALDPSNIVVVAAGPLVGTAAPAGARYQVVGKSPLTGTLSCLNAGGHFGAEMKRAGYDALIISGRAAKPVYIWIENGEVAIRPAGDLWGQGGVEVERALRRGTDGGAQVLAIGPAGERMVRIASIGNGGVWSAGGAGLGAVMGSKQLKAIAVKGNGTVRLADVGGFQGAAAKAMDRLKSDHFTSTRLSAYGTGALVHPLNDRQLLATGNFRRGTFASAARISGEAVADSLLVRSFACFGCPISCGRQTRVKGSAASGKGPEIEHLWALGSNCQIDDLATIASAAYLCQQLGLDPVEAGCAIATAMELRERGAISNGDAGADLRFGDGAKVIALLQEVGLAQGLGRIIGEGGYRLAQEFRQPDAFVGVRKRAFAAYDARANEAMALHYATALGADDDLAVGLRFLDQAEPRVKQAQDEIAAMASAGICPLVSSTITLDEVAPMVTAATGVRYLPEDLRKVGEDIWKVEAGFAARAGLALTALLPPRIAQPQFDGLLSNNGIAIGPLLDAYRKQRGWGDGPNG